MHVYVRTHICISLSLSIYIYMGVFACIYTYYTIRIHTSSNNNDNSITVSGRLVPREAAEGIALLPVAQLDARENRSLLSTDGYSIL